MIHCYKNRTSGGWYKDFQDQHAKILIGKFIVHVKIHPSTFVQELCNYMYGSKTFINSMAIDPKPPIKILIFVIYIEM